MEMVETKVPVDQAEFRGQCTEHCMIKTSCKNMKIIINETAQLYSFHLGHSGW